MVWPLVAAWTGLAGINGHRTSNANNERDQSLQGDAVDKWKDDRQFIHNEVSRLTGAYNNPAPQAITNPEAFDTWSHQDIYDALNGSGSTPGVQQADINAGADGWRRLAKQADDAIAAFRTGITDDINKYWSGDTANSAMTASHSYADEFTTLSVSFEQVAGGIDLIQGHLDQAKLSVPPPEELDVVDKFLGQIPGNGLLKLGQHRANEAEARAQDVMKVYQTGATDVDQQTPILPEPKNPVNSPGDSHLSDDLGSNPPDNPYTPGSSPTSSPYTPGSGDPSNTDDPGTPGNDPGDNPSSTDDPSSTNDPSSNNPWSTDDPSTDPSSTDPASTVPASNQPSGLTDPSSKPSLGSPGSGSPGSGSPGSGYPGSGSPGSGSPGTGSPGASIPGSGTTSQPTGTSTTNARTGTGTGRAGMPGMGGMGGGRGSGKDDENEHGIPDYLVQDRTTELLGEQPRVLPPGGVIGG